MSTRSGNRGVITGDSIAIGIETVLGADDHTVDLHITPRLLGEKADTLQQATSRATIWDDHTVLLTAKSGPDKTTMIAVTGRILRPSLPSGEPHRGEETVPIESPEPKS